jgi:hypothetical protein
MPGFARGIHVFVPPGWDRRRPALEAADFMSRNNMVRRSAARLLSAGFGPK